MFFAWGDVIDDARDALLQGDNLFPWQITDGVS